MADVDGIGGCCLFVTVLIFLILLVDSSESIVKLWGYSGLIIVTGITLGIIPLIYKVGKETKRKNLQEDLQEDLKVLEDFIYKDIDSEEDHNKPYIKKFHEAQSFLEEKKYESAEEAIENSRNLKEEENKLKERFDKLQQNFNQYNIEIAEQDKFKEIINKIKNGEYQKAENLIKNTYRNNGFKKFEGNWLPEEEIKEIKSTRIGLKNNFQNYTPYEFEEFIAKLFTEMGYKTMVTKKSADYGIDVVAEKPDRTVGVQVKQYSEDNPVGNKEVQNTLGSKYSVNADHTILVTTSYFTSYAVNQAKNAPIELWDKKKLHEMVKKHLITIETNDKKSNKDSDIEESNKDLAETLSNLKGKKIKNITENSVTFEDGEEIKYDEIKEEENKLKENSGCFIATAVYGTPKSDELDILRAFRDQILLENWFGRLFTKIYYETSPPIANIISKSDLLRKIFGYALVYPLFKIVKNLYEFEEE